MKMSIFKETIWETDETGDKLTKELFLGRKKKDKNKKKSASISQVAEKKFIKNDKKKKFEPKENLDAIDESESKKKINNRKRKSSEITIDEALIKKWKKESNSDSKEKRIVSGTTELSEKNLKKDNLGPKQKSNKKKLNGADSKIMEVKSKPKNDLSSNLNLVNKSEKRKLKREKKKLNSEKNLISKEEIPFNDTKKNVKKNNSTDDSDGVNKSKLKIDRLQELLVQKRKQNLKNVKKINEQQSLRDRMLARLKSSRFRYLNEQMYNNESWSSKKYFKDDPDAFLAYHEGYQLQVEQWPLNPLDIIIESIKKMSKDYVIADFGCGEARLADGVTQKVHSLDLVAINDKITACDMAHTPLLTNRIDVVVFCLSLMGTNLTDYLIEANRVLRKDGILKIAEVESRFEDVDEFVKVLKSYGFVNTWKDLSHNLFYFLDFKKEEDITKKRSKLPPITLKSCLYKRR